MKIKSFLCFLIISCAASAQVIPSSCVTTDSIQDLFRPDASRLALRHTNRFAETYKDSVKINPLLRQRYQDALIAVYNATALPVYDSLFNLLNVRTNPVPEMNNMNVKASPSLIWMQELYNNVPPTSSPVINNLMQRFNMQYTYLQATLSDVILFHTDTCLNLPAQSPIYISQGAIAASPETGYNDVRNITDSLNAGFILLNYSYGWGSCNDGCDMRRTWQLKVYNDCSVEYLGATGPSFFLGLKQGQNKEVPQIVNPVGHELVIRHLKEPTELSLMSGDGRVILKTLIQADETIKVPETVSAGLYFLKIEGLNGCTMQRVLIE